MIDMPNPPRCAWPCNPDIGTCIKDPNSDKWYCRLFGALTEIREHLDSGGEVRFIPGYLESLNLTIDDFADYSIAPAPDPSPEGTLEVSKRG